MNNQQQSQPQQKVNQNNPMDPRCPRKLNTLPCTWCSLAVLRLKTLRNTEKELSEEEENQLPGCPWAVSHQLSCYCFFKFASEYLNTPISDMEIAHLNSISIDTVKRTERKAMSKVKNSDFILDIKEAMEGEGILNPIDNGDFPEHSLMY